IRTAAANRRKLETCWRSAEDNGPSFRCRGHQYFRTAINHQYVRRMSGGTLKRQSLIFENKSFGRRGNNGGVFEVNQDPVSSEKNDCREPERDNARKQMRHFFPGGGTHDGIRSY